MGKYVQEKEEKKQYGGNIITHHRRFMCEKLFYTILKCLINAQLLLLLFWY